MSRKTILVADDDIRLLQAVRVRLRSEGFEVLVAQDAREALDLACTHRPDLLLLDIKMPGEDGFRLHERIQGIEELQSTPVIYLTGAPPATVEAIAADRGAFGVVHKPFDARTLVATIREALGLAVRAPEAL